MDPEHVISGTPAAPATSQTPPPVQTPPPTEDLTAIKKEIETLRGQVQESQRTAQFWYEKASTKAEPPQPKKDEEEEEVDVLDLATKGPKAFGSYLDKWAKKNGYAKREEVERAVNTKASQMTKEQELVGMYPDLKKKDSEFFQQTAGYYGNYVKQGMSEALAMELAAEKTELEFLRSGKIKTPQQQADDVKAQRERDRLARIDAQGGERGGRQPEASDDDDTLSDNDRAAVRHLADALDISMDDAEKRYIARAKAGVNVALKLGDRRRK